jgi:hypothetical protein
MNASDPSGAILRRAESYPCNKFCLPRLRPGALRPEMPKQVALPARLNAGCQSDKLPAKSAIKFGRNRSSCYRERRCTPESQP